MLGVACPFCSNQLALLVKHAPASQTHEYSHAQRAPVCAPGASGGDGNPGAAAGQRAPRAAAAAAERGAAGALLRAAARAPGG